MFSNIFHRLTRSIPIAAEKSTLLSNKAVSLMGSSFASWREELLGEASKRDQTPLYREDARLSISIVMPTHNRATMLEQVVRKTRECSEGFVVEWIVVDDGSTDHTKEILLKLKEEIPTFSYVSTENRGPGLARNLGASMAKHDVILFMGDDIMPGNEDFLRAHAELHAVFNSKRVAVLGKVQWPSSQTFAPNAVMRHIQGRGGEQFGYADFTAYEFLDWRFFYTCNVSVRRDIVADWMSEGFSPQFSVASFEDAEFAYKIKKKQGSFDVFYCPSSFGFHLHKYDVNGFLRRQALAGSMAHILTLMHPELGGIVGLNDVYAAMISPIGDGKDDPTPDYLAALEGLKAWARILEREQRLGHEAWHDELLGIVFEAAFLQGYVTTAARGNTNFARAYACILHRAKLRLGRILDSEVRGDAAFKARVLPLMK